MDFREQMEKDDRFRRRSITFYFIYSILVGLGVAYYCINENWWSESDRIAYANYPFLRYFLGGMGFLPASISGGLLLQLRRVDRNSQQINVADISPVEEPLEPVSLQAIEFQIPTPEDRAKLHRLMVEADKYSRWTNARFMGKLPILLQFGVFVVAFTQSAYLIVLLGVALALYIIFTFFALYTIIQWQRRNKALKKHCVELLQRSPHPCLVGNALYYLRTSQQKNPEAYETIANILYSMGREEFVLHFADHKHSFKSVLRSACFRQEKYPTILVRAVLHAVQEMEEVSLLPVVRFTANCAKSREVRQEAKECARILEVVSNAQNSPETLLRPAYAVPTGELLRPAYTPQETPQTLQMLLKPSQNPEERG